MYIEINDTSSTPTRAARTCRLASTVKCFLYQEMLKGRYPCPRSAFGEKAPSTMKSCGVFTVRHGVSGYVTEQGRVGSVHGAWGGGFGGGGARSKLSQSDWVALSLQSLPIQQPCEPTVSNCQMVHVLSVQQFSWQSAEFVAPVWDRPKHW